jgi:hypothetical protein
MQFPTSCRLVLTIVITVVVAGLISGQQKLSQDSAGLGTKANYHSLQFGLIALGAGIEYRYQFFDFVSADAVLSAERPGAAIGLTLTPISFVFVQGVFGKGEWKEMPIADGPPVLKPDYLYGWKAGLQIPVAPRKSTIYVQFGAGQLKYVQNHYLYNSGGFIVQPPPAPLYRKETRVAEVFALSLGFRF